jgi:hypothetical protein
MPTLRWPTKTLTNEDALNFFKRSKYKLRLNPASSILSQKLNRDISA